ncbi:deoxyribonuclease-1-like [Oratosquilla oratoria]|uniref:deoxyribonuclease-1-like n=1 Tax=Oratosquilla oratoria TaxID=337810 RepID=UPI003F771EB5
MSVLVLLVWCLVAGTTLTDADTTKDVGKQIKIAAWNLQRFGITKMSKVDVVNVIVKVMKRYDIIIIQEVVDSKEKAVYDLLEKLNNETSESYNLTLSERLGRSTYKEQYCIYWKPSCVNVSNTFPFEDPEDIFQYEPFTVIFTTNLIDLPLFAIMALHVKPSDAPKEIDSIVKAYDSLNKAHNITDVFIMGDFNAGCTYVTSVDWETMHIHKNETYIWLITNHTDTTSGTTSCPYDRILMTGKALSRNTYNTSAKPFYFNEEFGLLDSLTDEVSDHYPVEVSLRGNVSPSLKANVTVRLGVEVTTTVNWADVQAMNMTLSTSEFDQIVQNTNVVIVVQVLGSLQETITSLTNFSATYPSMLTPQAFSVLKYKLENEVLTDTSLYGASLEDSGMFKMSILCLSMSLQSECTTSVTSQTTIN